MAALKITLGLAALTFPAAAGAMAVDRWAREIEDASVRFGIPQAWIGRVMRAESDGETHRNGRPVVSRAGAMGLMQLMPGTWRDMRAALGLGADPFDPHDNILAGAFYLRRMYDRFGYPGLFAAYNAGPARYAAVLSGRRALPAETRAYVARVTRWSATRPAEGGARSLMHASLFAVVPRAERPPGARQMVPGSGPLFVELGESGR